jgi:hypothetical protein
LPEILYPQTKEDLKGGKDKQLEKAVEMLSQM